MMIASLLLLYAYSNVVKPYLPALVGLFTHVLRLCQKGGMSALGSRRVGWDGETS